MVAEAALAISILGAFVAIVSAVLASRSAKAAEQANKISAEMLHLQKNEAQKLQQERARLTAAHVRPVKWDPSNRPDQRGFLIKNDGPGVALEVVGLMRWDANYQRGEIGSIGSDQTSNLHGERLQAFDPNPEDLEGLSEPRAGQRFGRVRWQDADGSADDSGWTRIDGH